MRKITTLTATDTIATNNLFEVVDVNDYSMSETGTNKKISASDLANGLSQILTDRVQIVTSTNDDAVLISQSGGGNCLLVYDESTDSSPFVITNTGNVGIGKLIPDAKLDVVGTVKATAFLGPMTGDVAGNAATATTLKTARTIALDGDVVGVATAFDGSKAISIATSIKSESIVNSDISQTAAIAGSKIVPDFVNQNITTTGTLSVKSGSAIIGSSSVAALKITQSGAGDSLLVEDKGNVDNTPFVIDRFGRVIVGHTSVIATKESAASTSTIVPKLQVVGTSASNSAILISRTDPGVNAPRLFFAKSRGNVPGEFNAVIAEDNLGIISFGGADGTRTIEAARILAEADGEIGKDNMPGRLRFFTTDKNSSVPVERMRISSSGNIGIGSIDPQAKLHVDGSVRTKNISAVVDSTFAAVRITQTGTGRAFVVQDEMNDASPFVINRDGKVFIGTYSYLNGWNNNQNLTIAGRGNAGISVFGTNNPVFTFNRSGGDAPGGLQAVKKDDVLGVINFAGSDGIDRQATGARIRAQVSGTVSNGVMPSQLEFLTASSGGVLRERMIIDHDGNVGIGTSTPDAKLHVVGTVKAAAFEGPMIGTVTGNAETASKLLNAKTIAISGAITGVATNFDGSANITIATSITNDSIVNDDINVRAAISGTKIVPSFGNQNITTTGYVSAGRGSVISGSGPVTALTITQSSGSGNAFVVNDSTSDITPFVINNTGRVGIGTADPEAKLHVEGSIKSQNIFAVADSDNVTAVRITQTGNGRALVVQDEMSDASPFIINRAGKVFIGTTGYLNGWNNNQNLIIAGKGNAGINIWGTSNTVLTFNRSGGAEPADSNAVASGDVIGSINFAGSDGLNRQTTCARIRARATGTVSDGSIPGQLEFLTRKNSQELERMVIDSDGNVGIGTTNPQAKLHVVGSIKANVATKTTDGLLSSSDKTKLDDMYSNYASSIRVSKLSEKDNCGNRNTFDALVFIDTNSQIRAIGDSTTNTKRFGVFDLWTPSALLPLPNGALASKVYCNHGNLFAIDTQNRAYAMGNNNFGQCAIAGTTADISTFTACSLPASIKKIAIGTDRDVTTYGFLTLDGKVYTSGNNQYGQIGNDTQTNTANAGPVLSLGPGNTFGNPTEEIVDLQMAGSWNGSSHPQTFIALGASGKVYMVGFGGNGQMGNGTSNNVNKKWVTVRDKTAERFDDDLQYLTGITSIYAIGSDSGTTFYALREGQGQLRLNFATVIPKNNMLYGWGYNGQQQLGNFPAITSRTKAEYLIDNVKKFRGRTTAYGSAFAIRDGVKVISSTTGLPSQYYNEELWVAGDNFRRQLGIGVGDNVEWQSVPSLVDLNVEDVYGSSDDYNKNNATHTIVKIVGSNTLYGTGWNAQGQLALGTNDNEITFKKITVPFTSPIKDIECGYRVNAGGYTFILTEDGSLYHAGINRFGWSAMWAANAPKAFFTKINDYVLG